mmetsp:Transcript_44543/g.70853  ORF Transcript_44543/g.70853 Transcript_44543/m.70853 type:complete len:208 (-) Transcript_44543:356-979(-)
MLCQAFDPRLMQAQIQPKRKPGQLASSWSSKDSSTGGASSFAAAFTCQRPREAVHCSAEALSVSSCMRSRCRSRGFDKYSTWRPACQALTARRLRKSACRMGSGCWALQMATTRRMAVERLIRWPGLTTSGFPPAFGLKSPATGHSAAQVPGTRPEAMRAALEEFTWPTCKTSFATPMAGKSMVMPRCVAAPQPRGCKAPFPSTSTT